MKMPDFKFTDEQVDAARRLFRDIEMNELAQPDSSRRPEPRTTGALDNWRGSRRSITSASASCIWSRRWCFSWSAASRRCCIRLQLAVPNNNLLQPDTYNMLFTMHGTTMIFLVAMPVLFGLANYFVPLQIGARDMAFPRLNAFSFWLVPLGGILLHFSLLAGGAPAVGWFAYAPLNETPYSSQLGRGLLGAGAAGARHRIGRHGDQSHRHRALPARAGHDAAPAAALHVDDFHQFLPRHPRAAGAERRPGRCC